MASLKTSAIWVVHSGEALFEEFEEDGGGHDDEVWQEDIAEVKRRQLRI